MTAEVRPTRVNLGDASELPQDGKLVRTVNGKRILVIRSEGEFFACAGTCTHEPMDLSDGAVMLGTIECPLHGAVFDLRTGAAEFGPAEEPLKVYPCRVEAGRIMVDLDGQE